jgi:hypothetical protein
MQTVNRAHLRQRLDAIRTDVAAFSAGSDALVDSASEADREWLRDQLAATAFALGMTYDDPGMQRHLASRGMTHFEDDEPSPGPHPPFTYCAVRLRAGTDESALEAALARLQEGGGHGLATWGYSPGMRAAWLSYASAGATESEWRGAWGLFVDALEALQLEPAPKADDGGPR